LDFVFTRDDGGAAIRVVVFVTGSTWQQTLTIHPNNNRGTETQQSTSDFDANGNLLTLNNVFAVFAEDVDANVQSVALLFCLVD
jgi:uncharacterized membrane protein